MAKKPASDQPKKNVVTDADVANFGACVKFWQNVLGLNDWRINVSELRSKRDVMAEVFKFDLEQRSATIRVGRDFKYTPVDERSISDTALHECLHIFLYELIAFCENADSSQTDRDSAEHRVINVLERVLSNASPLGPQG